MGLSYDRVDVELCLVAPRGWGEFELQSLYKQAGIILRAQRNGTGVRLELQSGLHIGIERACQAYRDNGKEVPWTTTTNPANQGLFYVRQGKWATATGVGLLYPVEPVAAPVPVAEAVAAPELKARCAKCGYEPAEEGAPPSPTLDVEQAIDKRLMLSMRKDARLIVGYLSEAGGVLPLSALKEKMRQAHDVDNTRTNVVVVEMKAKGIVERPENGVYRLPVGAQ